MKRNTFISVIMTYLLIQDKNYQERFSTMDLKKNTINVLLDYCVIDAHLWYAIVWANNNTTCPTMTAGSAEFANYSVTTGTNSFTYQQVTIYWFLV